MVHHVCDICSKSFIRPSLLEAHRASKHMGVLLYMCSKCGVSFARKDSLTKHGKISCKMKNVAASPPASTSAGVVDPPAITSAGVATSAVSSTAVSQAVANALSVMQHHPAPLSPLASSMVVVSSDTAIVEASFVGVLPSMPVIEEEAPTFDGGLVIEQPPVLSAAGGIVEPFQHAPIPDRAVVHNVSTSCAFCVYCRMRFEFSSELDQHMADVHLLM